MRIRVHIDVSHPFRRGIHVFMDELLEEVLLILQYEHLFDFCYNYGIIGHKAQECTLIREEDEEAHSISKQKYGLWLHAVMPTILA